ncbi:MAG: hypothetical protein CL846_10505 [Crocinitomicaceae bacterium]|nr:hypothetical protein [Crocinitomicaceae bacterium]
MKLFYKVMCSVLVLLAFSCSMSKLTNYGKPLSFLSKERIPRKKAIQLNEILLANTDIKQNVLYKSEKNKLELNVMNNSSLTEKIDQPLSLSLEIRKTASDLKKKNNFEKNNEIIIPILEEKIQNVIKNNNFSNKTNTLAINKSSYDRLLNDEISDLVLLLICLLFPPVAVWWRYDFREQFWIDLALYAPMVFFSSATFAILPVLYAIYVCFLKKRGNTGDVRSSW